MGSTVQVRKRDWLVIASVALVVVPIVLMLALVAVEGFVKLTEPLTWRRDPALVLLYPLGLVLLTLLLTVEFRAVVRRELAAAKVVGVVGLYVPIAGTIGWFAMLIGLLSGKPNNPDNSWGGFAIYNAFLFYFGLVGWGHVRLWRQIERAKPKPIGPDDLA